MWRVIVVLFFSLACLAQDGKVIELTSDERIEAQEKYQALQKADREWREFRDRVEWKYLRENDVCSDDGKNCWKEI